MRHRHVHSKSSFRAIRPGRVSQSAQTEQQHRRVREMHVMPSLLQVPRFARCVLAHKQLRCLSSREAAFVHPSVTELIRATADVASLKHLLTPQWGAITPQQAVAAITHLAYVHDSTDGPDSDLLEALLRTLDAESCLELHGSDLASVFCSVSTWQAPLCASLLAPIASELLRETQFLPKLYTISSSELAVLATSLARQPATASSTLWPQLVKALAVQASQLQLPQLVDVTSLVVDNEKHTETFLDAVAAAVVAQQELPTPEQVARLFHSYAVAAHPHAALASTLAHAARQRIDDSTPDQMTSVLSSCITLGLAPPPHLLQDVSAWAQPRIDAFTPGQLSLLAKALAAHSFYDCALACRIAAASTARAAEFAPLQAVELLWAMSAWQHFDHDLCTTFAQHSAANLAPFPPTTLAILLWSLASLGFYSPNLFTAAAAALLPHLSGNPTSDPPPIPSPSAAPAPSSNSPTLHIAPLQSHPIPAHDLQPPAPLPTPLLRVAPAEGLQLSATSLYNIAWAFAAVRHHEAGFLHALETAVVARVAEFEPNELAGLLGAFADVKFSNAGLAAAVGGALAGEVHQLWSEGTAVAAWGLAMAGSRDTILVQALFDNAAGLTEAEEPTLVDVVRLRQAYIMLKSHLYLRVPHQLQRMFDSTAADLRRFSGAFSGARAAAVDDFREEVRGAALALGLLATPAVPTECGFFIVDLVVEGGNGLRVALDLVTRDKVSNTAPRQLWGGAVAVRRCLEAEGWRVVGVDREEWDALEGEEERRQLLRRELQVVIAEFA